MGKEIGNRSVDSKGYIRIYVGGGKRIAEHRLVMTRYLGRDLLCSEDVHPLNGDRSDNRPENLIVLEHVGHARHHKQLSWNVEAAHTFLSVGFTVKEVSQHFKVTNNAIVGGLTRLGRYPKCGRVYAVSFDVERAKNLFVNGATIQQVADCLRTPQNTIRAYFHSCGIKCERMGRTLTWSIDEALALKEQGFSFNKIGKLLGVTRHAITSAFKRRGL